MEVAIDRDSVHAGDDLGSHATSITLDPSATLRALIEVIQDAGYLPGINGGKATWIICTSDKPIGVLAQERSVAELNNRQHNPHIKNAHQKSTT